MNFCAGTHFSKEWSRLATALPSSSKMCFPAHVQVWECSRGSRTRVPSVHPNRGPWSSCVKGQNTAGDNKDKFRENRPLAGWILFLNMWEEVYGNSLYFLLKLSVNLKLLKRIKFTNVKKKNKKKTLSTKKRNNLLSNKT